MEEPTEATEPHTMEEPTEATEPHHHIREVLEVMYTSARTGGALPSTDLDSPAQLMAAWEQYRDSYGNNGLASGGGAKMEDARQATEAAAEAAQVGRAEVGASVEARAEASTAEDAGRAEADESGHSMTAAESQAALEHALFNLV
jgi:phosphoribosylformimino-5-aminoimidazole carboxamide ribonucleotide (ProFAR) isomerase